MSHLSLITVLPKKSISQADHDPKCALCFGIEFLSFKATTNWIYIWGLQSGSLKMSLQIHMRGGRMGDSLNNRPFPTGQSCWKTHFCNVSAVVSLYLGGNFSTQTKVPFISGSLFVQTGKSPSKWWHKCHSRHRADCYRCRLFVCILAPFMSEIKTLSLAFDDGNLVC